MLQKLLPDILTQSHGGKLQTGVLGVAGFQKKRRHARKWAEDVAQYTAPRFHRLIPDYTQVAHKAGRTALKP